MSAASRRGQGARWGWRWGAPAVVAALVIGLWYTVSYRLLTPDTRFLVPPPDAVLRIGFLDPFNRAELLDGLLLSARVAMLGLASAALIGICLAILMSQARWLERSVFPYLVLLQATPSWPWCRSTDSGLATGSTPGSWSAGESEAFRQTLVTASPGGPPLEARPSTPSRDPVVELAAGHQD
jgi:hypothetical protein